MILGIQMDKSIKDTNENIKNITIKYNSGLSIRQIADSKNVSFSCVRNFMVRNNIERKTASECNHKRQEKHCTIRDNVISIINGLLLSDAYLESKSDYSASFKLSMKYPDILDFVKDKFGSDIKCNRYSRDRFDKRTGKTYHSEELWTPNYVELKSLHNKWYGTGYKKIPIDLILDDVTILFWHLGDGHLRRDGKEISFATMGFDNEDIIRLLEMLRKHLVIDTGFISKDNRIVMSKKGVIKIMDKILKIGLSFPNYKYKMVF
jgi:hypothetical protein